MMFAVRGMGEGNSLPPVTATNSLPSDNVDFTQMTRDEQYAYYGMGPLSTAGSKYLDFFGDTFGLDRLETTVMGVGVALLGGWALLSGSKRRGN